MTATSASENDGAFQETFLLEVCKKGGTAVQFAGVTEDITTISEGDKDGEGVVLGNGGRIWKRTPEGDYEITVKIYPLSVDITDSNDMAQFFLGGTYDSTAPIDQVNTRGRDLFRVVILWTDDTTATVASTATVTGSASRRMYFNDARCTSYKANFGDKILSADVTFKGPAFNKSGTGTVHYESVTSQSSNLPALAAYT